MPSCELGCGLIYGTDGNITTSISAPACDPITTGGGANSGLACALNPVTGLTGLYVAPDAGGDYFRQARDLSLTLDGVPIENPVFNVGTTELYNTRNGSTASGADLGRVTPYLGARGANNGSVIQHNFSCARNWDYKVDTNTNASLLCSANFRGNFRLEESFDGGATWNIRDNQDIDNTGLGTRRLKMLMVADTWNGGVAPGATIYTDWRLVVEVFNGTATAEDVYITSLYVGGPRVAG